MKYKVILADPPWEYRQKQGNDPARGGFTYPILTNEDLKSLPISNIAADDCFLFIWITMPKLDEVFPIIQAWGFDYVTCGFTWIKQNKKNGGVYSGLGYYTNGNAELCLLAKRGKPKRSSKCVKQVVFAPVGKHSAKPHEIYNRIDQLCGDVPKIELFARNQAPGWDATGIDLDGVDIRDYLEWNKI